MLTLHPFDETTAYDRGPWAPLPEQLQAYLSNLVEISELKLLSECDAFHDNQFSLNETRAMADELAQFHKLVSLRALPAPPKVVSGSPGEIADEPFGWDGLSDFCDSLR